MSSNTVVSPGSRIISQPMLITWVMAHKAVLAAMLLVVVCAGVVRLFTFDRYYPIDDYVDEPTYVALAEDQRGLSDQTVLRETYGTLAPLYVDLSVIVQQVYDGIKGHPWNIPGEYWYVMRALSAVFGVITAVLIMWLGWQLAGLGAGLVSGLIWALSPVVVEYNSLAIPDPLVYLMCVLGVAAGHAGWKRRSFAMLVVSFLCGVAAIYLKLWIATALLPFFMATFLLVKADRSRLKRVAVLYAIGIGFALHFLLVVQPFSSTNKIQRNVANGDFIANLMNPNRLANNFWYMIYPTDQGLRITYVVIALGIAAYWYCRRQKTTTLSAGSLIFVTVCILGNGWLSAGISNVNIDPAGRMRHIFPASVSFIPLWAAFLMQIGWAARHWLSRQSYKLEWLPNGIAAAVLVIILPGFINEDLHKIATFSREHVLAETLAWFDNSPPHDGFVLSPNGSAINNLWNRFWGLYIGSKPYDEWFEPLAMIIQTRPQSYLERKITWFALDARDIARFKQKQPDDQQALQQYLDKLLLVKTFVVDPAIVQGNTVYIYRFARPTFTADYAYGDVMTLVGYDLNATILHPGDTVTFRPYWTLARPFSQNLSMFFHLYSAAAVDAGKPELLAQFDTSPMHNTDFPTSLWQDTQEVYFGDPFALTIPADLAAGDYVLALGLYDYESGTRLTGPDGNTYYRIDIKVD